MKEIIDINIQRMNNGAHFTFVSNILARAEADTAVKGKASELVSNFKAAVAAEDEALKISQKSLLTDEIAKADSDRDALYAGYKKAVEGFLAMPIADMAQAAKILSQHIKDYKINTADQLDKETGLLVNFISDLEDKYAAQVAKLGLTAFVTNLKEANERVRTLTLQRTNEKIGITVGALKTARTASDDAYRALVKMVNALALVFGEKDFTAFIDYVNTEITHYKREVLGRKASAPSTSDSSAAGSGSTSKPNGGGSTSGTGSASSGGSTSGGSSSGGSTSGGSSSGGSTPGGSSSGGSTSGGSSSGGSTSGGSSSSDGDDSVIEV